MRFHHVLQDETAAQSLPALGAENGAIDLALQRAEAYRIAALAPATRRAYATHWRHWQTWCRWHHVDAVAASATAVAAYLASRANQGRSVATVGLALAAIQSGQRAAGRTLDRKQPIVAEVRAGIARKCARPTRHAAPLGLSDLRTAIQAIAGDDDDMRALRDRALLLVSYFAALRRSEVVALDVTGRSPVEIHAQGVLLRLTGTKTGAATQAVAVPRRNDDLCPVAALEQYLDAARFTDGPLFRAISKSGRLLERRLEATAVRHILVTRLANAGVTGRFSPHGLRAGFISAAAHAGVPEAAIAKVSRHRSADVLRSYIRSVDPFADAAVSLP